MNRVAKILRIAGYLWSVKDPRQIFSEIKGKDIIFFDTETTGLDQHDNQITQIAAIRVHGDNFKNAGTFHKKIDLTEKTKQQIENQKETTDGKIWTVSKALENTKYNEINMPATEEMTALEEFKEFCEKNPSYLVAHNAKFDMSMIGTRVGKIKNLGVHDTMMFARMFFIPALKALSAEGDEKAKKAVQAMTNSKGKVSSTLGNVAKGLGVQISTAHTAIGDVETTVRVLEAIMNYIEDKAETIESGVYEEERQKSISKERYFNKKNKEQRIKKQKEYRKKKGSTIAGYLSKTPDYYYRLEGKNILLITKSPDAANLRNFTDKAKELKGEPIRRPARLNKIYKGAWFQMPDAKEAAALSLILRDEFEAKPM